MTAIPTKLYEAFEKIRLGKVEEGTRLFDRVDGFDEVKAIPLAELCYFRHDWKRGIQFSLDFLAYSTNLEADLLYMERHYRDDHKRRHLELILVATCQLNCWKESRTSIEELKKTSPPFPHIRHNYEKYQVIISLISDPVSTTRRLTKSKPTLRTEGKIDLETLAIKTDKAVPEHRRKIWYRRTFDDAMREAYTKASTKDHIVFYEQHVDRLEKAQSHQEAAKSYIALENLRGAKEALRQYMRYWKFKEPYQVAPIELFTDPELWTVMSDQRFTESLLTIPHHRES